MDALLLARLQFATTVGFHWLFVILTLGLAPLVAILHTRAAMSRKPAKKAVLERMTRFWGQLYVINYVLGIVTGLVMEFQFGLAWSGLSAFAGNVFGAPLALETLVAFFAESTFLGMWIFGWGRLRTSVHVTLIWLVTLTAYASAYWILVANGFMQHPVGYETRRGRAYLTDVGALLTNPNALGALKHIVAAALLTGGLFLAGVSAYHFLERTAEREFFRRSLRLGLAVAAPASFAVVYFGFAQFEYLARTQPIKFATFESDAPLSEVSRLQAQMVAQYGPGDYTPPAWIGAAFQVMQNLGFLMFLIVALVALPLLFRDRLVRFRPTAYLMVAMVPLPFVASVGGWVVREVGRQPWIVYGELTVAQARSAVGPGTMLASYLAFTTVFLALAVANWTLIARFARRGPEGTQLGAEPGRPARPAEEPVPTF